MAVPSPPLAGWCRSRCPMPGSAACCSTSDRATMTRASAIWGRGWQRNAGSAQGPFTGCPKLPALLNEIRGRTEQARQAQTPLGFEAEFVNFRGSATICRGILLPFTAASRSVDFLHAVVSWKQVARKRAVEAAPSGLGPYRPGHWVLPPVGAWAILSFGRMDRLEMARPWRISGRHPQHCAPSRPARWSILRGRGGNSP